MQLPEFKLHADNSIDSDGDGLSDLAEFILGSDPHKWSTCGDGISDLARVQQGLDFTHCGVLPTGQVGSLPLPGQANDITIVGSLTNSAQRTAYLACGMGGLSVVNVSQFENPIVLGQLNLPGNATGVAVDPTFQVAVVAANSGGLHFVDISNPMQPALLQTINTNANAVAIVAGVVYAAVGNAIQSYDLVTGQPLDTLTQGGANITGLAHEGFFLYAMDAANTLWVINVNLGGDAMIPRGSVTLPAGGGKLFVGNGIAYICAANGTSGGFATTSVANPDAPVLIRGVDAPNVEGGAIAPNGSGLAATVGYVRGPQGQPIYALDLMDVSNPANTGAFLTRFPFAAQPYAVAIGGGIAFVADGTAGLQVINYKGLDTFGIPPTILLSNSFTMTSPSNGMALAGNLVRTAAIVSDDVQVRNVEFYLDGTLVSSVQSFPFEYLFVTPAISAGKTNFTLQARAFDTGGNFTWTPLINVQLAPDTTPPQLRRNYPPSTNILESASNVLAYFNKPLDAATLNSASFTLISAGPDHKLGTPDDFLVMTGTVGYLSTLNAAEMTFNAPLPYGLYRATISTNLTDAAGDAVTNGISWTFWILPGGPNGDPDHDDLSNAQEIALGTDPLNPDTDGDGWADGVEIEDGKDPLDPKSHPMAVYAATPPVQILLPDPGETNKPGAGTTIATPPVVISLPDSSQTGLPGRPIVVAQPPVKVVLPGPDEPGNPGAGTTVASPPMVISLPDSAQTGSPGSATVVVQPPVKIVLPGPDQTGNSGAATTIAYPPVIIQH